MADDWVCVCEYFVVNRVENCTDPRPTPCVSLLLQLPFRLKRKMRNFAWVVLIIATIPVCLARKAGALGAVATTGEDPR